MPIYRLTDELVFPSPELADPDGILAVGGDLSAERLLLAYRHGIFPWFSEGEPIIWWSPDPRFVLYPENIHVSKSMRRVFNQNRFSITINKAFHEVIQNCQDVPRRGQDGTWITDEMIDAYVFLHEKGFAHSAEAWQEGQLVGGIYGIAMGRCFFGESMFSKKSNASKAAFITLVQNLQEKGCLLVDCQVYTDHLHSLGAESISRSRFLEELAAGVSVKTGEPLKKYLIKSASL